MAESSPMAQQGPLEPDSNESDTDDSDIRELAGQVLDLLCTRGDTLAIAESLTGGLVCAALTDIPGASAVVRGGIVAYATDLKAALLGVPRGLLDRYGAVHPDVAAAMAEGARLRLGARFSVATTGVAGPDPQDGQPVGTVHIAVAAEDDSVVRTVALPGDRAAVRARTVAASLGLLLGRLREEMA
ncbi:MAG TPA: CinA family protein [Streptosporangiaceae bacterium]|nr:CinA family protein [Streptosporangiaceae bacterium]